MICPAPVLRRTALVDAMVLVAAGSCLAALAQARPQPSTPGDSCLRGGVWVAPSAESAAFLRRMFVAPIQLDTVGAVTAVFSGHTYRLAAVVFKVKLAVADATFKAKGSFLNVGQYTTAAGRLRLREIEAETTFERFFATNRSGAISLPGKSTRTVIPSASVAYHCSGHSLQWDIPYGGTSFHTVNFRKS